MTDEDIGPIFTAKEEGRRPDWQDICHGSEAVSYTHLDVYKRQDHVYS